MNESKLLIDIYREFDERLTELMSQKGQNTQFFTSASYADMIEKVKSSKNKVVNKKPDDYQRLRRYDIVTVGEIEKLIVPVKEDNVVKFYVHKDEIFQILYETHLAIGHGGRNKMEKELNLKYKNFTREIIAIFTDLCETCNKRHKKPQKIILGVEPILDTEKNGRCEIDFIDMQSQKDNQYKFILIYREKLTKFIQLRPLKTKKVNEISKVLIDIFTIFGVPSILEGKNDKELAKKVVEEIHELWPDTKIIDGNQKHFKDEQFEGPTHEEIVNMLTTWLNDNNLTKWSEGLGYIQLMINTTHNTSVNCSPYKAMFSSNVVELNNSTSREGVVEIDIKQEPNPYD